METIEQVRERLATFGIVMNETVREETRRMMSGVCVVDVTVWVTFHSYGQQLHRSLVEAVEWNRRQAVLRG